MLKADSSLENLHKPGEYFMPLPQNHDFIFELEIELEPVCHLMFHPV